MTHKSWAEIIDNMFDKGTEIDIRVMSLLNLLSYRAEKEILPNVLSLISKHTRIKVPSSDRYQILGKLVAFMVYTGCQTILSSKSRTEADEFNKRFFLFFIKKFNETQETLTDFERDNPATGDAQIIWSLGSQICKLLDKEDAFLATELGIFTSPLTKIEIESTKYCLGSSLDELRNKIKNSEPDKSLYE